MHKLESTNENYVINYTLLKELKNFTKYIYGP